MWFVDHIADADLATDDLCAAPKTNLTHSAKPLDVQLKKNREDIQIRIDL